MPILLEGRSPQRIEYGLSLPHSLLVTASLICAADRFEGLADWLRETRVRLPADLYGELCLMVGFAGRYERFTGELLAKLPADANTMAFDDLMAHLRAVPGVHYQTVALKALARGSTPPPAPNALLDLLEDPAAWATWASPVQSTTAETLTAFKPSTPWYKTAFTHPFFDNASMQRVWSNTLRLGWL